jgi:hypothetical protein
MALVYGGKTLKNLSTDLQALALKEAITENRAAYNLPNAMIEQFQDDSKLGTETDGDRNASEYWGTTTNATATLISTAQTANAAQTKVSGVILYKNEEGTATLGTHLKIYFTCNGGTNWTESTPTAAGTFSSGILMAKCPEVICTSGTDIRYKGVWAGQSSGSLETELHGIGMNY